MKPAREWNEDDVWALPPDENDNFERKGARLLDLTIPGVDVGKVLDELSKQLSAFSNTGGGQIVYGVTDKGEPDNGGIARTVKGNTKAWLEDVIPILTEFEIVGCNVYEIRPTSGSKLAPDKSVYVVDVPDSDRAPHQAKRDYKYYVRLGGKSQPAPHRLIEDIRNRQKHPSVDVAGFSLEILQLPGFVPQTHQFSGNVHAQLRVRLKSTGKLMARNSCLHFFPTFGISWGSYDNGSVRRRGTQDFWELIDPLYPDMEISFWMQAHMAAHYPAPSMNPPWGGPWLIGRKELSEVKLSWRLFADNAPIRQGEVSLDQLKFAARTSEAIEKRPDAFALREAFPML